MLRLKRGGVLGWQQLLQSQPPLQLELLSHLLYNAPYHAPCHTPYYMPYHALSTCP